MNTTKPTKAPIVPQPSVTDVVRQFEPKMLQYHSRRDLAELLTDWCQGVVLDGEMRKAEEKGE